MSEEIKNVEPEAGKRRPWCLYGVGVLVLVIVGLYSWKSFEISGIREEGIAARVQVVDASRAVINVKTKELLRLSAVPLAWAVRTSFMQENYDQINAYISQLVREPNIMSVNVARTDGTIIASTNKKLEGETLWSMYPRSAMEYNAVTLEEKDGQIVAFVPLFGLDSRLGLLTYVYNPPQVEFPDPEAPPAE